MYRLPQRYEYKHSFCKRREIATYISTVVVQGVTLQYLPKYPSKLIIQYSQTFSVNIPLSWNLGGTCVKKVVGMGEP